jgi:competence protein ComEC
MDPGKFFLWLFLGFIAGCLLFFYSLAVGLLLLWLLFLAWRYDIMPTKRRLACLILIIGIISGVYRCFGQAQAQRAGRESWSKLYNTKANLDGRICADPDRRQDQQKLLLCTVKGRVLLSTALYPEYSYGDNLRVTGTIKAPAPIQEFCYDRYLALQDIYALIYFPQLQKMDEAAVSGWR